MQVKETGSEEPVGRRVLETSVSHPVVFGGFSEGVFFMVYEIDLSEILIPTYLGSDQGRLTFDVNVPVLPCHKTTLKKTPQNSFFLFSVCRS